MRGRQNNTTTRLSGVSRYGKVIVGVSDVHNDSDIDKSTVTGHDSSGNSRQHITYDRFNDAHEEKIDSTHNDSSGNSRQITDIVDVIDTCNNIVDGTNGEMERNLSGNSRQTHGATNRVSYEKLSKQSVIRNK